MKHTPTITTRPVVACLLVVLTLGVVLATTPAAAQSLLSLTNSAASSADRADRDKVLRLAVTSFERSTARVVSEAPGGPVSEETQRSAANISGEFARAAENLLFELEGDGILGVTEVESELGALREQYEQELLTVISAMQAGYTAPPLRRDFDNTATYLLALSEYTVRKRNEPHRWALVVLCLLAGLIAAWALNAGANKLARILADAGRGSVAQVATSLGGPLYLTALSCGLYFGMQQLWIPYVVREGLGSTVILLLVGALFWLCWNACPGIASGTAGFIRTSYEHHIDSHAVNVIVRILRMIVVSALVLIVVQLVLDTSLANLLAGLGIIGLALYFILRGTLENVAASFTIFGDEPFRVGDLVIYDDEWGNVEDIGFRSTRFRTLSGHLITIPNNELINSAITNVGARPAIRRRFRLGLTYETSAEAVRTALDILAEILEDHEGMPADRAPKIEFEAFGEYELRLFIEYHYAPADFWKALHFDTQVNLHILERFRDAGIDLAYPTERHVLETAANSSPPRFELVDSSGSSEHTATQTAREDNDKVRDATTA